MLYEQWPCTGEESKHHEEHCLLTGKAPLTRDESISEAPGLEYLLLSPRGVKSLLQKTHAKASGY